jgi:hypothetical protein
MWAWPALPVLGFPDRLRGSWTRASRNRLFSQQIEKKNGQPNEAQMISLRLVVDTNIVGGGVSSQHRRPRQFNALDHRDADAGVPHDWNWSHSSSRGQGINAVASFDWTLSTLLESAAVTT